MDAAADPLAVLPGIIAAGDAPTLRTLRIELPLYLLAGPAGSAVTGPTQKAAFRILDMAEDAFLNDAQRAARRLAGEIDHGWYRLDLALTYALDYLDRPASEMPVLPQWGKGTLAP